MLYVISYDLRKPGRDYDALYDELERFNARPVLQSEWCLRVRNTTAARLRDHFYSFMDTNDRILVVAIDGTGWAGRSLINKISEM